eukprot:scaffold153441_cov58-Attheya_sp.AAC.2
MYMNGSSENAMFETGAHVTATTIKLSTSSPSLHVPRVIALERIKYKTQLQDHEEISNKK